MRVKSTTDAMEYTFPKIEGMEDADYQEIIRLMGEEHSHYCTEANRQYADMVDYYTVWVHQIKNYLSAIPVLGLNRRICRVFAPIWGMLFQQNPLWMRGH